MKKIVALMLVLVMALSVCACAGVETNGDNTVANTDDSSKQSEVIKDSNNDGQIEVGTVDNVEVNEADEHMDAAEASASGKWESLFVPLNIEGRAIDMANFDLTPTPEELEAMKNEPAYGRTIKYFMRRLHLRPHHGRAPWLLCGSRPDRRGREGQQRR